MKPVRTPVLYVLMFSAMILWGLSWTNGKILGGYVEAPILMFWRFIFSAAALFPLMVFLGIPAALSKKSFGHVILGAIFLTLYNILYFTGTKIGNAGAGGVLVTTLNPLLTFFFTTMFLRYKLTLKDGIGLALGFCGCLIMLNIWQISKDLLLQSGNLYFLLCATVWAFLTITTSRARDHMSVLNFSFWTFLLSAFITLPFIQVTPLIIFEMDTTFWWNLVSISFGAMAFGTTIYFIGAAQLGSEKASSFIFTVPLFAMGFSMIFLDERLTWATAAGGALAMAAVYMINQRIAIKIDPDQ
ncbi:MAG: DMT family transporter [Candidatus Neomarinimicrobiota bacterium]